MYKRTLIASYLITLGGCSSFVFKQPFGSDKIEVLYNLGNRSCINIEDATTCKENKDLKGYYMISPEALQKLSTRTVLQ